MSDYNYEMNVLKPESFLFYLYLDSKVEEMISVFFKESNILFILLGMSSQLIWKCHWIYSS